MSLRLSLLRAACALVVRPRLARTPSPEAAALDLERAGRLFFRRPPFVCAIPDLGAPLPVTRVTCGPAEPRRIVLFLHGGAFLAGSAATHLGLAARLARLARVEVSLPDYRLLQQAPFPATFDDACTAWDHLRARGYPPEGILLAGDSAGGGLALALLARVLAGGERPAGLLAFSPWTDLSLSGATLGSAREVLLPVGRMREAADAYLGGADPCDPRASPLFAAFPGAPPVMIQVGGGEALADDSERMAARLRAAGAKVTLDLWEGCPHVWQIFDGWVPEARAALVRAAGFVHTSLASARR